METQGTSCPQRCRLHLVVVGLLGGLALACAGGEPPTVRLCEPGEATAAWLERSVPPEPEAVQPWLAEAVPLGERVWLCPEAGQRQVATVDWVTVRRLIGVANTEEGAFELGELGILPSAYERVEVMVPDSRVPADRTQVAMWWRGYGRVEEDGG